MSGSSSASSLSATPYPTAAIFFPGDSPSGLGASIIAANGSQTTYAVGCMSGNTTSITQGSDCSIAHSITVTAGPSTLIYTYNPAQGLLGDTGSSTASSTANSDATILCALQGGSSATQAICTGSSTIDGLGLATTTTLSAQQIQYATLTVTAGSAAATTATSTGTAAAASSTTSTSSAHALKAVDAVAVIAACVVLGTMFSN